MLKDVSSWRFCGGLCGGRTETFLNMKFLKIERKSIQYTGRKQKCIEYRNNACTAKLKKKGF
jgi:hypothetical protein